MKGFVDIFLHQWREALLTQSGLKITLVHLALVTGALLLGWPAAYTIGAANWAPALAWGLYAEAVVLSYLALAVPAGLFSSTNFVRPGQWILYERASPLAVYAALLFATLAVLFFWLLSTVPIMLLGLLLRPVAAETLRELLLFFTLLFLSLIQVGIWIGTAVEARTYRLLLVDIAYLVLMVGTLVLRTSVTAHVAAYLGASLLGLIIRPLSAIAQRLWQTLALETTQIQKLLAVHPLDVIGGLLRVTPKDAFAASAAGNLTGLAATSPGPAAATSLAETYLVPWWHLLAFYGGTGIIFAVLSLLVLRKWQRRYTFAAKSGDEEKGVYK